jgi:hypothetical protein
MNTLAQVGEVSIWNNRGVAIDNPFLCQAFDRHFEVIWSKSKLLKLGRFQEIAGARALLDLDK